MRGGSGLVVAALVGSTKKKKTTLPAGGRQSEVIKKKTANIQLSWNALTPSMALSIVELSTELPGRIRT